MSEGTWYDNVVESHKPIRLSNGKLQIPIDIHPGHEVTSNPAAYERLRDEKLSLRHPELTFAVRDHIIRTSGDERPYDNPKDELMAKTLEDNIRDFGATYFAPRSGKGGVCHVVFPEQGIIWPGMYVVLGDSHTSTYGALGAIAHGIGSTQVGHVLTTQSIAIDEKLKVRKIEFVGEPQIGVTAKDIIIASIRQMGAKSGNGFAHQYGGKVVDDWSVEERMTACNMGVECGAKVAYMLPDGKVIDFLRGKPYAPRDMNGFLEFLATLAPKNPVFDDEVKIDVSEIEPMITWGTSPDQAIGISERLPFRAGDLGKTDALTALDSYAYMQLVPGQKMQGLKVDYVLIASCTNSRLNDIAAVAEILRWRKVNVRTRVVAGSEQTKFEAERLGYAQEIIDAGAEWAKDSGCSACLSMSPDRLMNEERIVATTNRPFKHRSGKNAKTHLVSPYTAAATAIEGAIADPRKYLT